MPQGVPQEIERKYLVLSDAWRGHGPGVRLRQGYLSADELRVVRIRIGEDEAWITVKGLTTRATRREYEYRIPVAHAEEMLEHLCLQPVIDKTRYLIDYQGQRIEVDEFHGANHGLVVAEIELEHEEEEPRLPAWIGAEVTELARYSNAVLQLRPFCDWTEDEQRGP